MKNRTWAQIKIVSSLVLIGLGFQNMKTPHQVNQLVRHISPSVRETHAKELLGDLYKGSMVQAGQQIRDLNWKLYQEVRQRLPEKFQSQALRLTQVIAQESAKYEFDPFFVLAVIQTESSFDPRAKGRHGEVGLMQIRPRTAQWISEKEGLHYRSVATLLNPVENVRIGTAYLNYLRGKFDGYAAKYLSAYNMGATAVRRMYRNEKRPKQYAIRVMRNYQEAYTEIVGSNQPKVASN